MRPVVKKSAFASIVLLSAAAAIALSFSIASCATAPTPVAVRTFERAQSVDFVCMHIADDNNPGVTPITQYYAAPVPVEQSKCAPVPVNIDGTQVEYHMFALVTQLSRGEVAVVDLTGGGVVDVNQTIPGLNFLVVGQSPTDIATTPDGLMTFVAAAETNKPAIYGLPNTQILGDWDGLLPNGAVPAYTTWPSCSLPQAPGAMAIVPTSVTTSPTGDAGADGGAVSTVQNPSAVRTSQPDAGVLQDLTPDEYSAHAINYQIVVVLPGDANTSAKLITIDPKPFLAGGGYDVLPQVTPLAPGALPECPITSAVELAGASFIPKTAPAPVAWDDGIKYVEGGAPPEDLPAKYGTICAAEAAQDASVSQSATLPLTITPNSAARGGSSALAGQVLYVADAQLPIIHVFDLRSGAPQELTPLYLTSVLAPSRTVTVSQIAVSPPTRDFKRYLYAIDSKDGSLLVFDVTDPATSSHSPLTRPHPETNPFQAPDRISFTDPVATIGFARHEWPLAFNQTAPGNAPTGLLCNPNPAAGTATVNPDPSGTGIVTDAGVADLGVFYRANSSIAIGPPNVTGFTGPSPYRLRGIFGFATLTTGALVAIDIDDWDAPCRRPDPMGSPLPSSITPPEPTNGINPYGAPISYEGVALDGTGSTPVTDEDFFPVSAPNRARSINFLRNDATFGQHQPHTDTLPLLFSLSGELSPDNSGATAGIQNPYLMPTVNVGNDGTTNLADPSTYTIPVSVDPSQRGDTLIAPGVTYSFESADVHIDQDWTITYEGAWSSFLGLVGTLSKTDCSSTSDPSTCATMTLTQPQGLFCRRGVEDYRIGKIKAQQVLDTLNDPTKTNKLPFTNNNDTATLIQEPNPDGGTTPIPVPALNTFNSLTQKTGDYVQITDDILNSGDPYWTEDACWDTPSGDFPANMSSADPNKAFNRYIACSNAFGNGLDIQTDLSVQRDFPILEAYEDHLVLGRFGYPNTNATTQQRVIVGKEGGQGNEPFLHFAQCCFHNEFQFQVRTGGEWSAVGTVNGFVHHVTEAADGSCVLSCNDRESLMNARAPSIPRVGLDAPVPNSTVGVGPIFAVDRNLPLAFRNPFFSFIMYNGRQIDPSNAADTVGGDIYPDRDTQWRFSQRGDFQPLTVSLASTTTTVSPQTTKFVEALGQLAVVDGAAQGLMIIDLDLVELAHDPYF